MRRTNICFFCLLVMFAYFTQTYPHARADENWIGSTSGDWNTSTNWDLGTVPDSSTNVLFNTATVAVISTAGATTAALLIGETANGSVSITAGGTLTSTLGTLGDAALTTGTLTVSGTGASFTTTSFTVGNDGNGLFALSNGATASLAVLDIAESFGSTATVTVSGSGTSLTTNSLDIGNGGIGTMIVSGGASVTNTASYGAMLGNSSSSDGTLIVTGTGSTFTTASGMTVGNYGNARISILDGAVMTTTGSNWNYIGNQSGTTGLITVSGTGSTLATSSDLVIGNSGVGTLTITNGGQVTTAGAWVGNNSGTNALITISGTGSKWTASSTVWLGNMGDASLSITDGGVLETQGNTIVANSSSSTTTVVISGTGSAWNGSGRWDINMGNADVLISDGGKLVSAGSQIGVNSGSATITVTDSGSSWTNSGALILGYGETASLSVLNGATVSTTTTDLGESPMGTGNLTVSGTGSLFANTGTMYVGYYGTGNISVANGGAVTSGDTIIGYVPATSNTSTFSVSGTGSSFTSTGSVWVGQTGKGSLTISDSATVTISSGALFIATNTVSTGTVNIGAALGSSATTAGQLITPTISFGDGTGSLVFNHTSTGYTLSSAISGNGLIYAVSGKTILTGNSSSFTGSTEIDSGATLAVNGTLGGTTEVKSGGRLQGSGTLSSLVVDSGATVAPGNSIGTLTVNGNATFASGSTYEVEVGEAGASDLLHVTGVATLNNATLSLITTGVSGLTYGSTYTFLQADGGISGTLTTSALTSPYLFTAQNIVYGTNTVSVTSAANGIAFSTIAVTESQQKVADALQSLPTGNSLNTAIYMQTSTANARLAYEQLTGAIHADIKGSLIEDQDMVRNVILSRLDNMAETGLTIASPNTSKQQTASAAKTRSALRGNDKLPQPPQFQSNSGSSDKAQKKTEPLPSASIWAQGFGDWGHRDGETSTNNLDHNSGGLMAGIDKKVNAWRIGFGAGFMSSTYKKSEQTDNSGQDEAYLATFYAGRKFDAVSLRMGLVYGFHNIKTQRTLNFDSYSDYLTSSYYAHTGQAFADLGYGWNVGQTTAIQPFVTVAYTVAALPSFSERGGAAALHASGSVEQVGSTTLGLRFLQNIPYLGTKSAIQKAVWHGMAGWRHAVGNTKATEQMRFLAGGNSFDVNGAPLAEDSMVVDTGIDLIIADRTSIGVAYTGQLASKVTDQSMRGTFHYKF